MDRSGKRREAAWEWALLAALLLITLSLFAAPLQSSLWLDETITWWAVRGDASRVVEGIFRYQGQSPFYYLGVWWAQQILPQGEFFLRLPSLVLFFGSLVGCWCVGASLFGRFTASIALIFFVANDEVMRAAVSARPYALGHFCVVWSVLLLLVPSARFQLLRLLGSLILGVGAFYTHYFFGTALALSLLAILLFKKRRPFIAAVAYGVLYLGACVPAWPHLVSLWERRGSLSYLEPAGVMDLVSALFPALPVVLLVLSFALGFLPKEHGFTIKPLSAWRKVTLLAFWYLFPPLFFFLLSTLSGGTVYLPRYYSWYIFGLSLVFGLLLSVFQSRNSRLIVAAALVFFLAFRQLQLQWSPEDWRGAVEDIESYAETLDGSPPLFVYSGLVELSNPELVYDPANFEYLNAPLSRYPTSLEAEPLPEPKLFRGSAEDGIYLCFQRKLRGVQNKKLIGTCGFFREQCAEAGLSVEEIREKGLVQAFHCRRE